MNIQVTFDPREILKNIDRKITMEYVKNTITDKEKEEIGESVYSVDSDVLWEALLLKLEEERKDLAIFVEDRVESSDLLKKMHDEVILEHIKDETQYYISESIEELMEQIRVSGSIDEVVELFEVKYIG